MKNKPQTISECLNLIIGAAESLPDSDAIERVKKYANCALNMVKDQRRLSGNQKTGYDVLENEGLTRWKQEAKALLDPIWDYAEQHINVPLGKCKTEAVIKHVNEAKKLLDEVFRKHEAGLLPDRFIYEKIKTFLYGE